MLTIYEKTVMSKCLQVVPKPSLACGFLDKHGEPTSYVRKKLRCHSSLTFCSKAADRLLGTRHYARIPSW
jgi:hypothetical protein